MTPVTDSLRVLRHAAVVAFAEIGAMYTWSSWLFGWVLRLIMQITFFALIGVLLDDPALVGFLVIGNVALMAASIVMLAIPSTQWERWAGTLPLLVASPSRVMWVFLGRSVQWFGDALATSVIALLVAAPMFGVDLRPSTTLWLIPLLLLIIVSTYGLATYLGALVMRNPDTRNVVSNVAIGTMAAVTGANVPVAFFPAPIQWLAQGFPLTHGLRAVRDTVAGASFSDIAPDLAWCVLVGAGWMAAAALTFERFAESGRRDGSIEFGE